MVDVLVPEVTAVQLQRAAAANVRDVIFAPLNLLTEAAPIQHASVRVWHARGIHPLTLCTPGVTAEARVAHRAALLRQLDGPHVVAIGEIGMDARVAAEHLSQQEELMAWQLQLAQDRSLPIICHSVGHKRRIKALLLAYPVAASRCVWHNFRGPIDYIQPLADLGVVFSVGPLVLQPKARRCREAAAKLPAQALVVETDGHARHDLPQVLHALADLRGVDVDSLATQTADNARRVFKLPQEQR